ncbi:MAG TPA: xanthine dehydrogenase family protein molybdopterin-binding subunit, partial [Thermodesulfobacteriota bacterium]|nr:xanthine dehydrogenase family protein molybdopterin-binding subunit [Thermodesulfobacteriota bacterium]
IFAVDLKLPGMLHAKVLRSPIPHGRILRIDTEKAKNLPGVAAIVTGKDFSSLFGATIGDQGFLARGKVRLVGDAVAAAAAVDADTAEEALSLIKVEYEPLPGLFDPVDALKNREVLIHEDLGKYSVAPGIFPLPGTNICNHFRLRKGDMERGFKESDLVLEDTYRSHGVQHAHLEPHAAIAQVDPSGRVQVWTNTQTPYFNRKAIAQALSLPLNKVRITGTAVGGGFGGKSYLKAEPVCVALALKTRGRPVKLVYTREEEFSIAPVRHPTIIRCKTGMKRDGTWMGQETELIFDTGAYADIGPRVTRNAGFSATGPYKVPHVRIDSYCVYTNNSIGGAFRGFGTPQVTWAIESHLDSMAEGLGIDPLELRLKNAVEEGSISATGQALYSVGLKDTLRQAADKIGWGQGRTPFRGKGIACMHKSTVTPSASSAFVKLNEDKSVTLLVSTVEMGQGASTLLAQIVAEELSVPVENVSVVSPDTDVTPYDMASVSSRSTFFAGNAVRRAAIDAREQLLEIASEILEASPKDLVLERGRIFVRGVPDRAIPLADLPLGEAFYVGALGRGKGRPVLGRGSYAVEDATALDRETGQGKNPSAFWMYATQAAEVEVNPRTGQVKVLRLTSAHDVGRALHPVSIEGQIQGALVMGIGTTLFEDLDMREGKAQNHNFSSYKLPSALDIPEMIPIIVEAPDRNGPYGAKGLGEPALSPTAASIANAIHAATGVRVKDLPITPEKILAGLVQKENP